MNHKVVRTALCVGVLLAASTQSAALATPHGYRFAKVVDDLGSGFTAGSFQCPAINNSSEVVFHASRDSAGFPYSGIYRVGASGERTTVAEDPSQATFLFLHSYLSMNDRGVVAFSAALANQTGAVMIGDGHFIRPVASTSHRFQSLGLETSINGKGEVAFTGTLAPELGAGRGVFSGDSHGLARHYVDSEDVLVDDRPQRFLGFSTSPSINNRGDVAFLDRLQSEHGPGVYVGREGRFRTIAAPLALNAIGFHNQPSLNERGTAAFETSFINEAGEYVNAIVTGNGGRLRTIADTLGEYYQFVSHRPPAINDAGEVAFVAFLDDFPTMGIYTGPSAREDKVVASGDALDGATVAPYGLSMCERAINDAGVVTFVAQLEDPNSPTGARAAIFRAIPRDRMRSE